MSMASGLAIGQRLRQKIQTLRSKVQTRLHRGGTTPGSTGGSSTQSMIGGGLQSRIAALRARRAGGLIKPAGQTRMQGQAGTIEVLGKREQQPFGMRTGGAVETSSKPFGMRLS